jgi:hypothetical protein
MILVYGNAYARNEEELTRQPSDESMRTATLDFLDSVSSFYKVDGVLPKDWLDGIFWREKQDEEDQQIGENDYELL